MNRIRVQLDLNVAEVEALDGLRDQCALRSRADAVRYALGIMEWVAKQNAHGNQVLAVGKESLSSLTIPGLIHTNFAKTGDSESR